MAFCILKRAALLVILLPLSGCVIPVEGEVRNAEAIDAAMEPLAPGEKIVVAAAHLRLDDSDTITCVRQKLSQMIPAESILGVEAYRSVPGIADAYAGGYDPERLKEIADDEALRSRLADAGIRFLVSLESFNNNIVFSSTFCMVPDRTLPKQSEIEAQIVDTATGAVSQPGIVTVAGEEPCQFFGRAVPVTEGPACRHMAAMIASAITGRPLEELDPELAQAVAQGAAQ